MKTQIGAVPVRVFFFFKQGHTTCAFVLSQGRQGEAPVIANGEQKSKCVNTIFPIA